jgi:L-asparaginase / beta-aspartyl-peptidase
MKQRWILMVGVLALTLQVRAFEAPACSSQPQYTIAVHGGYVATPSPEWPNAAAKELTRQIVERARERLRGGTPALDVVAEAIAAFEDSGQVDAGKGSFLNSAGFVETDASLMVGSTGRSGAVAAMQKIKNPIMAARLVMEKTSHVLFVGAAGEQTLIDLGAQVIPDPKSYYKPVIEPHTTKASSHGTVGAVALDRCGVLAAGTSTGGTYDKMPGRVGDSPIIGASTFANEDVALSSTGAGEYFIKRGATRDIAARVAYLRSPLQQAADVVVRELIGHEDHARGAIIAISRHGDIVFSSTGFGLLHGFASEKQASTVAVEIKR